MVVNGVNGTANGIHKRTLSPGIYAPIPTFFLSESEDLDLQAFEGHVVRLAKAGVAPVVSGSMGEALHLSHSERSTLIRSARKALDAAGLPSTPIIAGTGTGSTRESIELCKEAASAGADFAIVIASGYYAGALANNRQALKNFWIDIASESPLPVMIYNYPGASGGIDLDSDLITDLAMECPNICGVKLTCGNVGKLTRIADAVSRESFVKEYPRKQPEAPFLTLGGFTDFLTPSTFANADGCITGLGNVAPHTLAALFVLSETARKDLSVLSEAQRIQGIVARADYTIAKASIAGTKYLLEKLYGYGGLPRRPLPSMDATAQTALWEHPHTRDLVQLERELSGKVKK